jgi:hypothetical protein
VISIDRPCFGMQFRRNLESCFLFAAHSTWGTLNKVKKFGGIVVRSKTYRLIPLTACLPSLCHKTVHLKKRRIRLVPQTLHVHTIFIFDDSDTPLILIYNIVHTIDNRNGGKVLIISKSAQNCFAMLDRDFQNDTL